MLPDIIYTDLDPSALETLAHEYAQTARKLRNAAHRRRQETACKSRLRLIAIATDRAFQLMKSGVAECRAIATVKEEFHLPPETIAANIKARRRPRVERIQSLWKDGLSIREISAATAVPKSTVHVIVQRFKKYNCKN